MSLLFALSLVAVPSAQAAQPWWQLDGGSRPTNLKAGQAQSEVQEILVTPEEGLVAFELKVNTVSLGFFVTGGLFGSPEPTAANLQAALEGPYGAGNVIVEEEAQGEATSFIVKSVNGAAFQAVAPIEVEGVFGTAEAKVLIKGRADGELFITAENVGDDTIHGKTAPVTLTDTLPEGLQALAIGAVAPNPEGSIGGPASAPLEQLSCHLATLTCVFEGDHLGPYSTIEVRIPVRVLPGAHSGEANRLRVSGGAAPADQISEPISISGDPTPFGVEGYELRIEEAGGNKLTTRAAAHPFQVSGRVAINQAAPTEPLGRYEAKPVALAKDVITKLPPGLIGNPTPILPCSLAQFLTQPPEDTTRNLCSPQSAVGVSSVSIYEPGILEQPLTFTEPLYNLAPSFGEPARFGFLIPIAGLPVLLDPSLRSARGETLTPSSVEPDYGIDVSATNISQTASLSSALVTFWGTPGDPRHDNTRGWACLAEARGGAHDPCNPLGEAHPPAFLSLPTSCNGPLRTSVQADPWRDPGAFTEAVPPEPLQALDSCNQVPFDPQIHSEPTSSSATSPTGLSFDINVNDEGELNPEGVSQSQIKRAVVTLPEGFTANPSVAEGLKACSEAEYEAATVDSSGCTEESKVGEVEIESPLVKQKVLGSLYVARQGLNPNHNLLTLYLVAKNPEIGVLIKQALKVTPDPVTGRLTTEVDDIPQLPFSHFHLAFRSGQRSPLITPPACGTYAVQADLYPYSNPTVPLHESSSFQITQGPEGLPCPSGGVPPFHPNLLAGSENPTAGAYSPFYTEITRKDSEQEITHFSIKLPPGVIGKLAGVGECPDAAIAAAKAREHEGGGGEEEASPSCPASSQIGHSNVGSGVGNVLAYAPGKLYLAGPYHGSNISLVSITAAKVGPFDLGTVVVRFALRINPETAEVFVDSQGSDPIPHIVDGIPVHLRDIQAFVDRPDFTLNPTSCKKKSTASTVLGSGLDFASEADDQPVTITSPFQVGSCASLGFAPKLALSLKGGTKRGSTPAFKAVLTYPKGAYANIAKSVVTLPHSEFLEQGHIGTVCTRVQFKEGKVPGEKCPAASIYGRAEAITPLLSEPLKGPVYLRSSSHNLPDLVAALHNNQVDFALDGRIDSIKNGRIRNTFETVPDAPVSKFVLEMQGGKKGLLVNSTNLCARKNRAISEFTGQNGKLYDTNPVLQAKCHKRGKKANKRHGAHQ